MNYKHRIEKLQQLLPCEALLIEHPINILYLSGIELSVGKLLVTPTRCDLIVDGRYIEAAKKQSLCEVFLADKMPLKEWLSQHQVKTLAFDGEKTSYEAYIQLQKMGSELKASGGHFELVPLQNSPLQQLRLIKDEDEIKLLREAAILGCQGYAFLLENLKEGIKEAELAVELEYFWRKKGAKKVAFDPIIAFGVNSAMPHHRAGATILHKEMPVLIDIGVTWRHYHSDMTRVIHFGKPLALIQKIYEIVQEAKDSALALCKPGTLVGDLDRAAREVIARKGYGEHFIHSLGHGVGLDIHEPPILRDKGVYHQMPLKPGMVITIEPGIYLPEVGGVRLEDTILITESTYENFTNP